MHLTNAYSHTQKEGKMSLVREEISARELVEAQAHVSNHIINFINTMSLKCAVQLGIPDIIQNNHGQSVTLSKLVETLQVNPAKADAIHRLMRILIHTGIFEINKISENDQEEEYLLTPASRLLLTNEPLSLAPNLLLNLDPAFVNSWLFLSKWFHDDGNGNITVFESTYGIPVFEYMAQEPKLDKAFHETMTKDSQFIGEVIVGDNCKEVFKGLKSLVDVGGGKGFMARAIAEAFPEIKCIVFDLPYVVANLQGTSNLEFVGGDMFQGLPSADAVLLKLILHNWDDEESIKLLKCCREAIPSKDKGGKLIIIDMVLENQNEDKEIAGVQLSLDMLMMTTFKGKERNEKEWKRLFLAAGFSDYHIRSVLGPRSLIEVYP